MTVPANVTRFLFTIPSLSEELRVVGFRGEHALSSPFWCELEIASENSELDLAALIGKGGLLTLFDARTPQYVHGEVVQADYLAAGKRFVSYRLVLKPKLAFLDYRSNLRIFQQKSVPDIVRQVLKEAGISELDVAFQLTGRYPPREYCTQYHESDLAFISRLMEQEGLFYFFQHHVDHHKLVITDSNNAFASIAGDENVRFRSYTGLVAGEDSIYEFMQGPDIRPGKVVLRDYNFEKSRLRLEAEAKAKSFNELEQYEYTTQFTEPAQGSRYADLRQKGQQYDQVTAVGRSDCGRLWAGTRFRMKEHPRDNFNLEYTLIKTTFLGRQPQSLDEGSSSEGPQFVVDFTAIPSSIPYRPPTTHYAPKILGAQTAMVTGPSGEEIYTDKYGRVKVQFHWDREGQYNQASSCWLRVCQSLAGNQWGAMVIPRVGQEVTVQFMDGNPDRPLVMGVVYNGVNEPPYPLPANQTRSLFKSHTSPGGGGYNEIRIEDKKGSEQLYIHGQKDADVFIQNEWREWVGNEQHITVGSNRHQSIGADLNDTITNQLNQLIAANWSQQVSQSAQIKITGSHNELAAQTISIKAGTTLVLEAGVEITLTAGGGLVKLDPSGVTISGTTVKINSGGAPIPGLPASPLAPVAATLPEHGGPPGSASVEALPNTKPKVTAPDQENAPVSSAKAEKVAVSEADTTVNMTQVEKTPTWISIKMEDEDGNIIANRQYRIVDSEGNEYTGTTDGQGMARLDGIPQGACEVTFPEGNDWKRG